MREGTKLFLELPKEANNALAIDRLDKLILPLRIQP